MRYATLLEAQMGEYPDSLVLTDEQVYDALKVGTPDWLENHKFEDWSWYAFRSDFGSEQLAKIFYNEWRALEKEQTRAQWARAAFMYRSDTPEGFFYACGKRDDGTYRHVGFRYGLEDCEYASGFHGLTYTPQGESK
jgi:hypothetical protein